MNVAGADSECLHSMRWVLYWNVRGFLMAPFARPKLTPLLSYHCCTDTPNQQSRIYTIQVKYIECIQPGLLLRHLLGLIGYLDSVAWWRMILTAQEVWTYRMSQRCIPGSAVLLGCWYKVLKSVIQEPLAVRCQMRWVVYDNVGCSVANVVLTVTDTSSIVSLLYRYSKPTK
jgi:hypothetical protein